MKKETEKFDLEAPLPNPKHEAFCQAIAKGLSQPDAYRQAGFICSDNSVHAAASRLAARPEVKARGKALQLEAISGSGPITSDEIRKRLEFVVRTSSSGSDIVRAAEKLQEKFGVMDDVEAARKKVIPDPCAILSYVCSFSGMTGAEIVEELGGRDWMTAQLSEILKVPVIVDGISAA